MDSITVREMLPCETAQCVSWLITHKEVNKYDATPFLKRQVRWFVVEDETGILAFVPVKFLYMYDALAPKPGITDYDMIRACQAMHEFTKTLARNENIGAMLLQPNDSRFSRFLQKLGFKKVVRETLAFDYNESQTEAKEQSNNA